MKEGKTEKIVGINHQTFRQKMASYKRHPGSLAVLIVTLLAAVITVGVLLSLIVYIVVMGVPNLRPSMFAWKYTTDNCSMMPSIINTLIMTALTLLIAVPIGVFSAIYLVEYSNRGSKFQMIDLKEKGMSRGEFDNVARALGGWEKMVNPNAKDKQTLALLDALIDWQKEDKLFENQQLLLTPIVRNGRKATVGYQPDVWKTWE